MPRRLVARPALALFVIVAAGCRRDTAPVRAGGEGPALRPTAAPRPAYKAPSDGRLSKAQVEAYVGVLEALKRDESRPPGGSRLAPGDPLDLVPPDDAVAGARGLNLAEYAWVKERVLEAEAARLNERLLADHLALLEKTLADLRARRQTAADEGSKKLLSEQIANFEAETARTRREAREKESDAVRANMKTIEVFRVRLEAAGDVLDHPLPALRRPSPAPAPAPR